MSTTTPAEHKGTTTGGMSMLTLAAMVVGSMVGAGVFSLPARFGAATGVFGALVAWAIAGTGMLMLAFTFQSLAVRKPRLDAGVYAYAKAGFGELPGFFSAFGFWASACVGNVTYWVLIKSTLGAWIPAFGEGNTIPAIVISSIGIWGFYLLIMRGVQGAAWINTVVTIAKLVPILVFLAICVVFLDVGVFMDNFWGGDEAHYGTLFDQVRKTMLVTVFVFLGIEGASVYSRYARRREDVGRATVLGFLSVLAVFASITIVSYGILPASELGDLRQPSLGAVLEEVVGPWGSVFIGIGLIVSVLGAYLAWTLMSAEVLFVAAKDDDMPPFLARETATGAPGPALLMTTILIQVFLVVTYFSENAFDLSLDLTAALALLPFALAAGYALRLVITGETYDEAPAERRRQLVISGLATAYTVFLLFAAGLEFLLLSFLILAPGLVLFFMARRAQGRKWTESTTEVVIVAVAIIAAVCAVVALATGFVAL